MIKPFKHKTTSPFLCRGNSSPHCSFMPYCDTLYKSASIGQGYGLTKTCAVGTFSEYDDTSVSRVDHPLPCSFIKLVDWPKGGYLISDSPPVSHGGIVISGPNVTLGYFKNDEKSKEVYKVDEKGMRWFHTGDVGSFHADGSLEVIDPKKDIVNYSIENMFL